MTDPKAIERIMDREYAAAEFCDCCDSADEHKEKVEAAYEKWADQEYDRRRDEA